MLITIMFYFHTNIRINFIYEQYVVILTKDKNSMGKWALNDYNRFMCE